MKPHVIIIPGAKTKHPRFIDPWLKKYYTYFGVETSEQGRQWIAPFSEWLENTTANAVTVFDWPGGVSATSILLAARKLAKMIDGCGHDQIVLFAKSMGGNVADFAVRMADRTGAVKKIIYVATPHQPVSLSLPGHIQRINIYSTADNYLDFANRTLFIGLGKKHLPDIRNIILPAVRHGEFMKNVRTEYQGRPTQTYELFSKLIGE